MIGGIEDTYPIPNISNILDKLDKRQYFTTFSLASGFQQIKNAPRQYSKTAFNIENGHYR